MNTLKNVSVDLNFYSHSAAECRQVVITQVEFHVSSHVVRGKSRAILVTFSWNAIILEKNVVIIIRWKMRWSLELIFIPHRLGHINFIRVTNSGQQWLRKILIIEIPSKKGRVKKAAVGHIPGMKQEQRKLKLDTVEVNVGRSIENKNGQSKINTCHKSQWKAPTFSMPWQRKLLGCLLFDFAFIAWLIMMRYLFSFSFSTFWETRWREHTLGVP